jgi:hypothetical protein
LQNQRWDSLGLSVSKHFREETTIAKNILQNVEQLNQNVTGIDVDSKWMMNVLGAHKLSCLNRLEELGGGMEGICLSLKGFVDWKVDMRRMLEEVNLKNDAYVPTIEESAEKHVKVIYDKMEELLDGVSGILV